MDYLKLAVFQGLIFASHALCNYPTELLNKEWDDTVKGKIVYNGTNMSGWTFNVYSHTITEWECHFRNDDFVASRSKVNFGIFGSYYRAYLCQNFKMSTNKVYYYLMSDKINTGERVYVSSRIPDSICDVCSPANSGPDDGEYYELSATNSGDGSNPTVGCNSCTHQCDVSGTPALTTTPRSTEVNASHFETGPSLYVKRYTDDESDDDNEMKDSSPTKVIVGILGGVLGIALIASVGFWMTRRGLCVRNVLNSFYEEKKLNPI